LCLNVTCPLGRHFSHKSSLSSCEQQVTRTQAGRKGITATSGLRLRLLADPTTLRVSGDGRVFCNS
jgi:hypothetical protein